MSLVANVESDEKRGDVLNNAGILELAAVDRADTRNFGSEIAHRLSSGRIFAAHDHVALHRAVAVHHVGGTVLKGSHNGHAFGDQFRGLLGGRSLPDAERARSATTDSAGERNGSVDQDAARLERWLEFLQQSRLAFEGYGEGEHVGGSAGIRVRVSGDYRGGANFVGYFRGCITSTLG